MQSKGTPEAYRQHWDGVKELQARADARRFETMARRICPATGTDVIGAW